MLTAIGELLGIAAPYLTRMLPTLLPQIAGVARLAGAARAGTQVGSTLLKGAELATKLANSSKGLKYANYLGDAANLAANTSSQYQAQVDEMLANGASEEDAHKRANIFSALIRAGGTSAADILTSRPGASGNLVAKAIGLRAASGGIQGLNTALLTGKNPLLETFTGAAQGTLSGLPDLADLLYSSHMAKKGKSSYEAKIDNTKRLAGNNIYNNILTTRYNPLEDLEAYQTFNMENLK